MNTGDVIRSCRREQNLTQESLAELLSVSPQAVSRWETGLAMPDISLVPRICGLFGISADRLLCIDIQKKENAIREISEKAREKESDGYGAEAVRILRAGLLDYPNSWKLTADLADALFCEGEFEESLTLARRAMEHASDMEIHAQAVFTASCVLDRTGRHGEAVNLANTVPETGRHDLLRHLLTGEERIGELKHIALIDAGSAFLAVWQLCLAEDGKGGRAFGEEERERMLEGLLDLYRTFFADGDLFFYAQFPEKIHRELAKLAAARGEREKALGHLRESVRYGLEFADYDPGAPHTTLWIRGETDGGWVKGSPAFDYRAEMRKELEDPAFDVLREDGSMEEVFALIGGQG